VVTAFFGFELLIGLRRADAGATRPISAPLQTVIIIPAHDEEAIIGETVTALRGVAPAGVRILVVADNCNDRTAEAASAAGAEVLIRNEPERRGKGFALAAARDHLAQKPPAVVVVIDADCRMDETSIRALTVAVQSSGRACQAVNLLSPQLDGAPMVQISTFAFMIKNLVRQRALQRLAGIARLNGTGMAFPWPVFAGADLGGSNIVEDLALGMQLAAQSAAPMLVEGASVWSPAAPREVTLVQRKRWEGGYLATALKSAPSALGKSIARGDLRGICAALDLAIPPLALLFVVNAITFAVGLVGFLVGASPWPLIAQVAAGLFAAVALVAAWQAEGRRFASAATLLRLPLYVLWKVPLYAGFIRRGAPRDWLRTGR
jgi:cellulose synthase/poly-beta-1,6-N-acetylglucosamine synthase-like glycosyltransferase